jgi:hypothetical protein
LEPVSVEVAKLGLEQLASKSVSSASNEPLKKPIT